MTPIAYNAEAGNAVNLHLYNREPRFYASSGLRPRHVSRLTAKNITLYLRGGELHGSTLKETDEYQSCTGYLCQKWIPKACNLQPFRSNSFSFYNYAYPYLRLPELYYELCRSRLRI